MRDFPSYLAAVREPIDAALDRLLPAASEPPARVHEAMRYSVFAGGKRVRPALVLLTGETLGVARELLLPGGAAIEMIHTYSLIHDDLPAMDDDDLRRGRPTVHRRFDEATAVLAGDALLTLGLTLLAVHPAAAAPEARRRAVELVGEAVGSRGMIGGQADDMAAQDAWPADAAGALEAIHRRKTGALLTACVRLAGVYAGVGADDDALLAAIGDQIGLLFQIGDDILDVEGTSETLGKTAGKDAAARKLTYPGLHGLDESKKMLARARDRTMDLAARLPRDGGPFPSLIHYLATRDR
ncbi:MAG TPA: farnesyl diphosphate synthase [Thermoanaerobaculia bacterium]